MMVYICTKFHDNILNGIRVMEQTRKVNGPTDRRRAGHNTTHLQWAYKKGFETCHPYSNTGLFCVLLTTARGGHFETEKIHCKSLLSKIERMPVNF